MCEQSCTEHNWIGLLFKYKPKDEQSRARHKLVKGWQRFIKRLPSIFVDCTDLRWSIMSALSPRYRVITLFVSSYPSNPSCYAVFLLRGGGIPRMSCIWIVSCSNHTVSLWQLMLLCHKFSYQNSKHYTIYKNDKFDFNVNLIKNALDLTHYRTDVKFDIFVYRVQCFEIWCEFLWQHWMMLWQCMNIISKCFKYCFSVQPRSATPLAPITSVHQIPSRLTWPSAWEPTQGALVPFSGRYTPDLHLIYWPFLTLF